LLDDIAFNLNFDLVILNSKRFKSQKNRN